MNIKTVGSVCSGIEAASVAWIPLGFEFKWFSEIESFPSQVLNEKYPNVVNVGDMNNIAEKILSGELDTTDMICAGTPCQAFSLAGLQNGLDDERGNLTLNFVDIVNANDLQRSKHNLPPSVVFWENVEGVLSDKTNAFGCLVSSLAGFSKIIENKKWPNSGVIHGPKRNVAWRVLDAKFFGLPQQRKRLYLLAGGKDFFPENILFEKHHSSLQKFPATELKFDKAGHSFEVFREYTDCLYAAYGTKWNGNAAAYNGSLFVSQDNRLRRLSPLECERLMGFPDDYTNIPENKKTARYKAIGNSWAIPVVKWIGDRIVKYNKDELNFDILKHKLSKITFYIEGEGYFINLGKDILVIDEILSINCTFTPEICEFKNIKDIVSPIASEDLYISAVGCSGILRRKNERNIKINLRLEEILTSISKTLSPEEIEKRSRIQKRGRFSLPVSEEASFDNSNNHTLKNNDEQISFFDMI